MINCKSIDIYDIISKRISMYTIIEKVPQTSPLLSKGILHIPVRD